METDFYTPMRLDEVESPLQDEVKKALGIDIETCMECGKCSGGCSNAHIFDFTPRKVIQLIRLGAEEILLTMDALWVCLSCQLCVDRCPSGIDIPRIMDYLREKARREGYRPSRPAVALFYELMCSCVERRGRVSEAPLMLRFNILTRQYLKDLTLGIRMFLKGKLPLTAGKVKKMDEVRVLFASWQRRSVKRG